ncbi:MAG: hypothetical protein D6824_00635 [Planctomycetota bacterium]|nr:MAG: hypothetical protein D6824_00635 [Planctomycetota bacterium]
MKPGVGSRLIAVFADEDLHLTLCRWRLRRARVVRSLRVARFAALQRIEQEAAVASFAPFPGEVVVLAPGSSRVIGGPQLDHAQWRSGRDRLLESIEELLPIARDEAVVGHVDLFDPERPALDRPVGGALVAMRRSELEALTAPLLAGLGARSCVVLPACAAATGVPRVAQQRRCVVVEGVGSAAMVAHTYAQGLLVAVEEPLTRAALASMPPRQTMTLPGAEVEGLEAIAPQELALGACFVTHASPGLATPLGRTPPRPVSLYAGPVALTTVAALLLVGGAAVREVRQRERLHSVDQAIERWAPAAMRAQRLRSEAIRTKELLEKGIASTLASWRSPLPVLAALREALGEEGFYYRVDVDEAGARLRGEAPDASAVLQQLASHPLIASAAFTAPVSVSTLSGMEVFEISVTLAQDAGDVGEGERS